MADSRKTIPNTVIHIHIGDLNAPMRKASDRARSKAEAMGTELRDKTAVEYRRSGGPDRCAVCVHNRIEGGENAGRCKLVAGMIRPEYVCDLWESTADKADERRVGK